MPIGPNESAFSGKSNCYVAIKEIDERLIDPDYMTNMRRGTCDEPYWDITLLTLQCELSKTDKEAIIKAYTEAGWSKVIVRNSSEFGECPGLCGVALYK